MAPAYGGYRRVSCSFEQLTEALRDGERGAVRIEGGLPENAVVVRVGIDWTRRFVWAVFHSMAWPDGSVVDPIDLTPTFHALRYNQAAKPPEGA